jgi:hypothetical protein
MQGKAAVPLTLGAASSSMYWTACWVDVKPL